MERIGNIGPAARAPVLVTAVDEPSVVATVKEKPAVVVGVKRPLVGANTKEPSGKYAVAARKELSAFVAAKEELSVVQAAKGLEEPFVVAAANNAKELFAVLANTAKELFDALAAKDAPSVVKPVTTEPSFVGAKAVAVVTTEQWPLIAAQQESAFAVAVSAAAKDPKNWPLTIIGNEVMLCSEVCGHAGMQACGHMHVHGESSMFTLFTSIFYAMLHVRAYTCTPVGLRAHGHHQLLPPSAAVLPHT